MEYPTQLLDQEADRSGKPALKLVATAPVDLTDAIRVRDAATTGNYIWGSCGLQRLAEFWTGWVPGTRRAPRQDTCSKVPPVSL